MINTIFIIFLIIAVMLLIYLSIKLFLFQHRKIENLIVYDNDIYIKINGSTFFNIKRKMEEHLSLEKHDISDEYTATFGLMKFVHLYSIKMSEDAVKKTTDRIISGVTVDYINNQLKQFCDKDISTETDADKSIDIQENISKENKQS